MATPTNRKHRFLLLRRVLVCNLHTNADAVALNCAQLRYVQVQLRCREGRQGRGRPCRGLSNTIREFRHMYAREASSVMPASCSVSQGS